MKILRNTIEVDDRKISHFNYNECETFFPHYANNELIQFRNVFPTFIVSQYDYIYDAAGHRSERYHSGSAFATPDQIYYDYNSRSELTNAVASVDATYNFSYSYDDIGNRLWSIENTNFVEYTANGLDQYTAVDAFTPQYDADGNQTLIKTATGIWAATYNGENRPIYWSNGVTNIVMSFDRMGRRVQYLETTASATNANNTFTYDNYLCIARHRALPDTTTETDSFIWDPTEPIATRPLVFDYSNEPLTYYTYDGNKNVSEFVDDSERICGHYEYDVYGMINCAYGLMVEENPWRFSSECYDIVISLVYYNYRHYNPESGRWCTRDYEQAKGLYAFVENTATIDILGLMRHHPRNNRRHKHRPTDWESVLRAIDEIAIYLTSFLDGELINNANSSENPFSESDKCRFNISVNGMANKNGDEFAATIKDALLKKVRRDNANQSEDGIHLTIYPVHNPSNYGFGARPGIGDILQSIFYEIGLDDLPVKTLESRIQQATQQARENGCTSPCIVIYAHSQGTMLTYRAFKRISSHDKDALSNVVFCGYGGEQRILASDFSLLGAENHVNFWDFMNWLNPRHWFSESEKDSYKYYPFSGEYHGHEAKTYFNATNEGGAQ